MRLVTALAVSLLGATLTASCSRDVQALDAREIEQRYSLSGAYGAGGLIYDLATRNRK